MVKPKPLFPGARVALVAPAGPLAPEKLPGAVEAVRKLGLEPVVFDSCHLSHGYLAGTDRQRARDLNAAFADPSIDGVFCVRGGYGCQRLMHLVDFQSISRSPKIFCGYSDVTALHIALNQFCGITTCHTPMLGSGRDDGEALDEYTMASLRGILFGTQEAFLRNPAGMPAKTFIPGRTEGVLSGGNLSLVSSSLGTHYEIDTRGRILFLEDVDEEPYRIDRMLTQLRNAGKFRDCSGLVLGLWTGCEAKNPESSLTLAQIFEELLGPIDRPVISGFACGHSQTTMSLPLGAKVCLDADRREMLLL